MPPRRRVRLREAMSPTDSVLWSIEHDPVLRSTITAIGLFDRAPDWDRLVARMEQAVVTVPRFGQRVVTTPFGLGRPRWVPDPHFDLSYHLRRVEAPEPHDLSAVLAIAQPITRWRAFDRERPLWEFTVVEGLANGRAALIQKVHHSLTDGVGGVELALALARRPARHPDRPTPAAAPRPPARAARLGRAAGAAPSSIRSGASCASWAAAGHGAGRAARRWASWCPRRGAC